MGGVIGGGLNTYGPTAGGGGGTNVLMLQQMVTIEELQDDEEYTEIVEDVRDECTKYGTVKSITIPRPNKEDDKANTPGIGMVFVEFEAVDQAKTAQQALQGRTFESRTVVAAFFDPQKYAKRDFT